MSAFSIVAGKVAAVLRDGSNNTITSILDGGARRLQVEAALSPTTGFPGGLLANGATGNPNPLIVGGRSESGNVRTLAVDATGQLKVVVQQPTDAIAINIGYDQTLSIAGAQANYFYAGVVYPVPAGYRFVPGLYGALFADNRCSFRISKTRTLGSWTMTPQVFSAGATFTTPAFASFLEAEVTTATGNVDDTQVRVTYTNQDGVAGRVTANALVKKNTPIGFKVQFVLQGADYGVLSVQNVTYGDLKTNTGTLTIKGGVEFLTYRQPTADESVAIVPGVGSVNVAPGELLELAFASNGAAAVRRAIQVAGTLQPAV